MVRRGGNIQRRPTGRGRSTFARFRQVAWAAWALVLAPIAGPVLTPCEGSEPIVGGNAAAADPGGIAPTRVVLRLTPRAIGAPDRPARGEPRSAALFRARSHRRATCDGDHHDKCDARSRRHRGLNLPIAATDEFAAACDAWGIERVERIYSHRFMNPEAASRHGLDRTFVVDVPEGADPGAVAAAFAALDRDVESASVESWGTVAQLIPDDALFDRQYGMHNTGQAVSQCLGTGVSDADIDAPEAWALHTGTTNPVTIAIIDTGVTPHVEFAGRMVAGINTLDSEDPNNTDDDCPHGTHVAGIAAAEGDNGIGVAGVSWGASIMPVRVLTNFGFGCVGSAVDVAEGIVWAVDHGADICNVSIQFCPGIPVADLIELEGAVNYAYDNGVLVVSAAGNTNFVCTGEGNTVRFPARFANSMAVSATNRQDQLATISNSGPELDVAAPGECIWSTLPFALSGVDYGAANGTSFATPHVSGLAALLKSLDPTLSNVDLRNLINSTADDLGAAGRDNQFGFGRINAYNAVVEAGDPRILASDPPDGAIDARQPFNPDGSPFEAFPDGSNVWKWIDLTFPASAKTPATTDFVITEEPDTGVPISVLLVVPKPGFFRAVLSRQLAVGSWSTITHVASGTSVRLGVLPGDSDGSGTVTADDLTVAADALRGVGPVLPPWSVDLNRSGAFTGRDLLREVDLLSRVGFYAGLPVSLP